MTSTLGRAKTERAKSSLEFDRQLRGKRGQKKKRTREETAKERLGWLEHETVTQSHSGKRQWAKGTERKQKTKGNGMNR